MEPTRVAVRPKSSASTVSARSVFSSRHKHSAVSINSSRTSLDSSFSSVTFDDFVEPNSLNNGLGLKLSEKAMVRESVVPLRSRSSEIPKAFDRASRLASNPNSPTQQGFGQKYRPRSSEAFRRLPEEILFQVLGELKKLHLEDENSGCSTCWTRDLISLGLSCKKWWKVTQRELYQDIQLVGLDSAAQIKKKFKIKYGSRLVLLRRTLRHRAALAGYVKSLKVPSMPEAAKTRKEQDQYLDLVASVIMACPNLVHLPGFYPPYRHEFSHFPHALSTRFKLKERVWVIDPIDEAIKQPSKQDKRAPSPSSFRAPPALTSGQRIDFLDYHTNWTHMQTLVLHCNPGGTVDSSLFTDIFNSLPSLRHLSVSSFPTTSFTDQTLLALPPLTSLRLDALPGITSRGLSAFATITSSTTLQSLSLVSLPLLSLPVLARLFSHLTSLTTFTLSQSASPSGHISVYLHPYLASRSLRRLHWEFTHPTDTSASEILAKSIQHNGFPSLRFLRAPVDPNGLLQSFCKPISTIMKPEDRNIAVKAEKEYEAHMNEIVLRSSHSALGSHPVKPFKSPITPLGGAGMEMAAKEDGKGASLKLARRAAQKRIDNARSIAVVASAHETKHSRPKYRISVWDEFGTEVERADVGRFFGTVGSKVEYWLEEGALGGSNEGVVRVPEWLARNQEGGNGKKDKVRDDAHAHNHSCDGNWNRDWFNQMNGSGFGSGGVGVGGKDAKDAKSSKGKEKERWWHTERPRWREIGTERLFG